MKAIRLFKHLDTISALSSLSHMDDALDSISFLTANDFIVEQLRERHQKTKIQANALAKRISVHANLAVQYAKLSLISPPEISFLPGYYSILNLSKIFILIGDYSNEFDSHAKWHGASYSGKSKSSQTLLTEEISIATGGVLALFYKTLTHRAINKKRVIKLRDFYHLVPGVGAELNLLTKKSVHPLTLEFKAGVKDGIISVEVDVFEVVNDKRVPYTGKVSSIPCLKNFKIKTGSANKFVRTAKSKVGSPLENEAHFLIRPEYLCYVPNDNHYTSCYTQNSSFPLPEEFASALAYFHMSSVCRYNPEFLQKLSNSKAWPMLLQARRHTLLIYLLNTFGYLTKSNYYLITP